MTTFQAILLVIFLVSTIVGYLIINRVPSLLHTPLMSGMNALSGATVVGAIAATTIVATALINDGYYILGIILGSFAIILAMINVVGGFVVTHRMLRMFKKKKEKVNG